MRPRSPETSAHLAASLVAALLAGCPIGGEDLEATTPGGDAGPDFVTEACGEPPAIPIEPEDCGTFASCLGGANIVETPSCNRCPRQPAQEVCASGACVPYDRSGRIQVAFEAPLTTVGARSVIVSTFTPVAADGTRLTCDGLLADRCDPNRDEQLNPVNVNLLEPVGGINDAVPNFTPIIASAVGSDRLVLVQILRSQNGTGTILAEGCLEGIEVRSGDTTQVIVEVTSVP